MLMHLSSQSIPVGMGVVGTAVARGETTSVPDITKFAGHIACDPITKSEIVIPILKRDSVISPLLSLVG